MNRAKLQRKLQNILGIDLNYLFKNGGIVMMSHTVGTLCGFGITLLLGNFVDGTTYGQYKYVVAVAGILGAFALTGGPSAVLQSVAQGFEGAYAQERLLTIRFGLIPLFLSGIGGVYYLLQDQLILGIGLILVSGLSYLQSIFSLHVAFLNGKRDFKRLARNQIFSGLLNVGVVGCAVFLNLTSVIWLVLAYNGSQLLYQIFASRRTWGRYTPNEKTYSKKEHLSKHLSLGNIIGLISEYIDKILIFQLLGPAKLALYAFATGLPDQFRSINKVAKTVIVPKLNAKNDSDLADSVMTHTKKYVGVCFLLFGGFWLIAPHLYQIFFPQYIDAVPYASLYMLIVPIISFGMLHGEALQVKGLMQEIYVIRIIEPLLKIVLFLFLIPHFGIMGAILSILISKSAAIGTQIIVFTLWRQKHIDPSIS